MEKKKQGQIGDGGARFISSIKFVQRSLQEQFFLETRVKKYAVSREVAAFKMPNIEALYVGIDDNNERLFLSLAADSRAFNQLDEHASKRLGYQYCQMVYGELYNLHESEDCIGN